MAKIGKMSGTLYEGLYVFIVCFLMKKNCVLCEVRSEVEDTDQDLITTEAGIFPCAGRQECEDIIDSLNVKTSMLYALNRAHCC